MNTPVSLSLAKLLTEKGVNITCSKCYAEKRVIDAKTGGDIFTGEYKLSNRSRFIKRYYSAPTIAEVVMWLYEKHGIFIQLFPIGEDGKMKFYSKIIVNDNGWVKIVHQISTIINSPTEAYEAAISHTLNNLI